MELRIVSEALGCDAHTRYSHQDDIDDIELEIKRLLLVDQKRQSIRSMRGNVAMAATAVEMVNHQLGKVMELRGFAREVAKEADQARYDAPLERLHRKHWLSGVGTGDPEKDLLWALVSSAGMYHAKNSGIFEDFVKTSL